MAENVSSGGGNGRGGGGIGAMEVTMVDERQQRQREALKKEKAELIARFSALLSGADTTVTPVNSTGSTAAAAAKISDVQRASPCSDINNDDSNEDKNVGVDSSGPCNGNSACSDDETAAPARDGADTILPSPSRLLLTDDAENEGKGKNKSAHADEEVTVLQQASAVVRRHIAQLHEYNSLRDVAMALIGLLADSRGVRVVDVLNDFGIVPGSD